MNNNACKLQNLKDTGKFLETYNLLNLINHYEIKNLEIGSRWQSRRTCSHSLLREHGNHNCLLDNHRQEHTGTHQKRYPTSKDKGEAAMRQQEGRNHNKIKSHNCWVGDPQTGEHLYHRSPPSGVKVLRPTSGFPTWGSGNGRRNSQRIRL